VCTYGQLQARIFCLLLLTPQACALPQVTGHKKLLETNLALRRLIEMRNPYIDPINILQVCLPLLVGAAAAAAAAACWRVRTHRPLTRAR
jgi:hypothetical protein